MNIQTKEILRIFLEVHLALPIQKVEQIRQYIGGVKAERNILSQLCLLVKTSPINLAVANRIRNIFFIYKCHVQSANNPQLPQSQTESH